MLLLGLSLLLGLGLPSLLLLLLLLLAWTPPCAQAVHVAARVNG